MICDVGILDRILHPNGREPVVTWDAFLRSKVPNPDTRKRYEAVVKSFNGWRGSRPPTDARGQGCREKMLAYYALQGHRRTYGAPSVAPCRKVGVGHDEGGPHGRTYASLR